MTENVPPRMYTSEVLALARWGASKLAMRRKQGLFPDPIDRGREAIYDGPAVYKALGLIRDEVYQRDRWLEALDGKAHSQAA